MLDPAQDRATSFDFTERCSGPMEPDISFSGSIVFPPGAFVAGGKVIKARTLIIRSFIKYQRLSVHKAQRHTYYVHTTPIRHIRSHVVHKNVWQNICFKLLKQMYFRSYFE